MSNSIAIGTKNPAKIQALIELQKEYSIIQGRLTAVEVNSGVPAQPNGFSEISRGAENRALGAYQSGTFNLSFGIESGIVLISDILYDFCMCAIYDGKTFSRGISGGFPIPSSMVPWIQQGKDLSEAAKRAGFTTKDYIGFEEGIIGILTKGRLTRAGYTKQAITMALTGIENVL